MAAFSFLGKHIGLLVSALLAATVVIKVLVVAHWNPTTVAALLQTRSGPEIAMSAIVLGVIDTAWVPVALVAVPAISEAIREKDPLLVPTLTLAISLVLVAVVAPWWQLVALCAYGGFHIVVSAAYRGWRRWRRRQFSPRVLASSVEALVQGGAILLAFWIGLVTSASPWLPAERFHLAGGKAVAGYVLHEDDASLVVMEDVDRQVMRIWISKVRQRAFCDPEMGDARSVVALLLGFPRPGHIPCSPTS